MDARHCMYSIWQRLRHCGSGAAEAGPMAPAHKMIVIRDLVKFFMAAPLSPLNRLTYSFAVYYAALIRGADGHVQGPPLRPSAL